MRLTRLFALTTMLLVALVGVLLSNMVLTEWRGYRFAGKGLEAMETAYKAMVVAEKVSAERGPTNGVLGDADTPDPEKRARLAKARATSDGALRALADAIAANPALVGGEAERAMRRAQAQLATARQDVDQVAAMKRDDRSPERLMGAVHEMFDVIPVVMESVTLLSKDAEAIYPQFSDSIVGARLAAELREHAGRLGSQFTAALNAQKPLAEPEQHAIQVLRGRIEQLQVLIELPTRTWQADPRIVNAIQEMKQRYFGDGLAFVASVEKASQEGRPYGMDTAQFAARYVPDMGSIVQLRDVMISIAIEGGQARKEQARRNLAWMMSLGLAIFLVLAAVFVLIRERVLKPLLGATRVLGEIANGQLDAVVPAANRVDEIGDMLRAVAALKQSSIDKQRLEEQLRASRDQIASQASQLEQQNEALKENVRLREEVERIGRHDIKIPLNSIIAIPRLLRERKSLPPDDEEMLGIVERAGYRILSMVNLSLDLFKMENGTYIFRPDVVDLGDLVRKVMTDLRTYAATRNVNLRVVALGTEPVRAWAEELLCYSMLANLMKNAVEASPERADVTVRLEPAEEARRVCVRIHNRGSVPASIRGSFFRKYQTAGKASGTGLGAYSAWRMAKVQDGDIAFETSDEDGTTITVKLRAAPAGHMVPAERHAQAAPASSLGKLAALNVLVVDDDEINVLILRRFLPPPLRVESAGNGRAALELAAREHYDVVIMDLDMPVMGGLDAIRALRQQEATGGTPRAYAVALSSHEDARTQAQCLEAGFDRYVTKPVSREKVEDALAPLAERAAL